MKTKLFSIVATLFITVTFAQQKLIAIKGTTTDAIATTLTEAITLAQPNDKIYLPGGNFDFAGTIDKPIHIIGIGFQNGLNIDGITQINGDITINANGNNSMFEGFYLSGNFICLTNGEVNNIHFKRLNISGVGGINYFGYTNCVFINCVIRNGLDLSSSNNSNNNLISNCFFKTVNRLLNSTIQNCIIGSNYSINGCTNINIKNNIFSYYSGAGIGGTVTVSSSNLNFSNNVFFQSNNPLTEGSTLTNLNPLYYNSSASEVFTDASDFIFNPNFDFQLLSTFAGNNAGDDGTDVGIYGGQYPWKNGSLPVSPNIEQNNSFLDVQNEQFKLRVKVVPQTN